MAAGPRSCAATELGSATTAEAPRRRAQWRRRSDAAVAELEPAELLAQLSHLEGELSQLQGEAGLIRVCVDAKIVGEVISAWTGIPVGKMMKDEIDTVLSLQQHAGQPGHRSGPRSGSHQPADPDFASQPGRSEQAGRRVHAGGTERRGQNGDRAGLVRSALRWRAQPDHHQHVGISGSAHRLHVKGFASGIRRIWRRRRATEAVRRRPYSVVLLDEVEKAHPDVLELFYQVFDKGMMEDGEGREIDFKNNIIILTTNAVH